MARLEGRRVLLTRSFDDSADWADALAAEGAEPIVFPCIHTEDIVDPSLVERLGAAMRSADWLIFTSRHGVDAFCHLIGSDLPATTRIAAVGKMTAAQVQKAFGRVDHIGGGNAMTLALDLAKDESIRGGAHCVLALASNARIFLERTLAQAGARVDRYNVYHTIPAEPIDPKHKLTSLACDTILFASPSAVEGFDNQVSVDTDLQMVTIGPTTTDAVRERNWTVTAQAKEPSLSGIIASLLENAIV